MAEIRFDGEYDQPQGDWRDHAQPQVIGGDLGRQSEFQAPGYTPDARGNTGITGGMDRSNWERIFGTGVQDPTKTQATAPKPFDMGAFQQRGTELGRQFSGSMDDFINHIFPQLSQEFQGIERFGSKGDKIRLPNGQVIDAVISAGLGGRGYNWSPEDPASGHGYSSDPLIAGYIDRMNGLIDRLSAPQPINPTLQDAISKLQGMFDNPGYTDSQRALMRTNLQEPLESQRAASQQRVLARASDRGLGLGSGVLEQEAQGVDQGFDRLLSEALRQMSVNEIGMQNQQRMGAAGQLAGIGSGLQGQELQALAQALGGSQSLGMLPLQLLQSQTAAMNSLNNQQVPQQDPMTGLISILASLAGQGEHAFQNAQGQDSNFWASLFGAIPGLVGAFSGRPGSGPTMDGV